MPPRRDAAVTTASIPLAAARSAVSASARPPPASISPTNRSSSSPRRATSKTEWPRLASSSEKERPRPPEAPVTTAQFKVCILVLTSHLLCATVKNHFDKKRCGHSSDRGISFGVSRLRDTPLTKTGQSAPATAFETSTRRNSHCGLQRFGDRFGDRARAIGIWMAVVVDAVIIVKGHQNVRQMPVIENALPQLALARQFWPELRNHNQRNGAAGTGQSNGSG